ncbi:hypothetical protein SAMN05444166_4205 [Singulisphaera sp. GP187]|uniref:hypothetical protein n=1 Tax=Singulisphaera sp. GP187 TaxID=1882752 RepID=UPI00092B9F81|nr:hypothetical protein [Singulisphaera sp. GP187]SIO37626.1 hypothetical protein SAMN05444166_4205 [Singulisphaera sp. GP187]
MFFINRTERQINDFNRRKALSEIAASDAEKAEAAHTEFIEDSGKPAVYGAVNVDPWGQKRIGDWIQTRTGVKFHLLDPRPEDFRIEDIAHALAHMCRFNGHVSEFYSVAEHSVRVARRVAETHPAQDRSEHWFGLKRVLYGEFWSEELQYHALMHDTTEAFICDLARPFKQLPEFAFYREIEHKLMVHIANAFGFPDGYPFHPAIKNADEVLLGTEARDLMDPVVDGWHFRYKHLPERIKPWSPRKAKREFLKLFYELNPLGIKKPSRWASLKERLCSAFRFPRLCVFLAAE